MEIATITAFLRDMDLLHTVSIINGEEAYGVAPVGLAVEGDVAWTRHPREDFKGSLLLNNRLAMALVIQEFFPEPKGEIDIHSTVKIGDGSIIGSDGFGFVWDGGKYIRWPHVGGLVIESDVEIGSNNTVDRGSIGDTIIRRGVKTDNLVHIAHNCDIGEHTMLAAGATLSGSVRIGERAWIGVGATISNGIDIGDGSVIGAGAVVVKSIPPGECWIGNPARFYKEACDVPRP